MILNGVEYEVKTSGTSYVLSPVNKIEGESLWSIAQNVNFDPPFSVKLFYYGSVIEAKQALREFIDITKKDLK